MTFDEFTRMRLAPLLRFTTMLCIDAGLAEDLVQEVLIKPTPGGDRSRRSIIRRPTSAR